MSSLRALASLTLLASSARAQGYAPDPKNVPPEFMCKWRSLSLEYSKILRPDAYSLVKEALDIEEYCNSSDIPAAPSSSALSWTTQADSGFAPPRRAAAGDSVFVDCDKGSESGSGSIDSPLKTLQAAVDMIKSKGSKRDNEIVVRASTCYQMKPVVVTPELGSNLTIRAYEGEQVWVSGGVKLNIKEWKPATDLGKDIWMADLSDMGLGNTKFTGLRKNGMRMSPARFPNANPEVQVYPIGYLTSDTSDWLAPKISPKPNPAKLVDVDVPNRDWDAYFSNYGGGINGTCAIYDPPFSFWCQSNFSHGCGGCFTWNIPSGIKFTQKQLPKTYTNWEDGEVFAFRKAHWANWMFEVESYDPKEGTFTFGKGGFQGARGGPGSDWFIQNFREELDMPYEYYYDRKANVLYMHGNSSGDPTPPSLDTLLVGLVTSQLLNVVGPSKDEPVRGFRLDGIGFRDAAPSYLEPHGVPSGGDWALERIGALFVENTEDAVVNNCTFWRLGGNAIMLSKYNNRSTIQNSDFAWLGGSGIAAWGWTDELTDNGVHGYDGTGGFFPDYTFVLGNVMREIGIWEKQSSGFFQAKSARTTARFNVVFNLARAGFNFNDGFGGGDVISDNLLFNTCRESSDHGPINSWDRQPFQTTIRTGEPSFQMEFRDVTRNLLIANYGGTKEVDNDDGSLFWRNYGNFMAYGWAQKFKCGGIYSYGNLKAFIDLGGKFDAGCVLSKQTFYPNLWHNDTMIVLNTKSDFSYRQSWNVKDDSHDYDKSQVQNNTIYLGKEGINAMIDKETLKQIQAKGEEPGSVQYNQWPSIDSIIDQARKILNMPSA